jgi:hypothetical protein
MIALIILGAYVAFLLVITAIEMFTYPPESEAGLARWYQRRLERLERRTMRQIDRRGWY